jgi:hypothetical protein
MQYLRLSSRDENTSALLLEFRENVYREVLGVDFVKEVGPSFARGFSMKTVSEHCQALRLRRKILCCTMMTYSKLFELAL